MKIPKTIRLFGYDWKVKIVPDQGSGNGGGKFDWAKREIIVKKRFGEHEVSFLHEVIEAILVHNHARFYGQEGNMEYEFHFNHTNFARIVYDIYQALKDNKII